MRLLTLWLWVLARLAAPLQAQSTAAPAETRQAPELWFVISALKQEGTDAWRKGEPWPRSAPDFAQDKGWTLPADAVVRGLTRRLDAEPAVDAYIRWQLLSFLDSFESLSTANLERIGNTAPKPLSQPVVREEWLAVSGPGQAFIAISRQTAYVRNVRPVVGTGAVGLNPEIGIVQSGVVLEAEGSTKSYITVIHEANEKLESQRAKVNRANEAILRYRSDLLARMPDAGGMRLAMIIKDAADRVAAGDPSAAQAAEALAPVAAQLPADVLPGVRKTLASWARRLAQMKTTVHDYVAPGEHEKHALLYTHEVAVGPQSIETLLTQLEAAPTQSRR
jgi:hypothetical protein